MSWKLYIAYVLAETLLLVMGILAALAIDNWWEEQKEKELEEYLIEQLLDEFQNDSLQLSTEIEVLKNKAFQGETLRESIQDQSPMPTSELAATAFAVGKLAIFESYTPTFEEIVSSGRLNILRNTKLKVGIKAYKNYLDRLEVLLYAECQRRKEDYNKHLYKYFEPRITGEMWENIEDLECWDVGTFDMNVRGFYQDPNTVYSLNSVIGMDKELIWTYSTKCSEYLNQVIILLETELKAPRKKSFLNRIDVYI